MTPQRVLVTGSNGFVGRGLCAELIARGHDVRGGTRQVRNSGLSGLEQVVVDSLDAQTDWQTALSGCSTLVHLAARVHVMQESATDPLAEFRSINMLGTLNLARQAALAGVQRFVFVSSVGVNGRYTRPGDAFSEVHEVQPHNAYAQSKHEAELALRQIAADIGMEVVIIRPPLVYGPHAPGNFGSLMRAVRRGLPLPLASIRNQRSLVALDNLVDFIIRCGMHPKAANETFLVSDGQDLSTPELIRRMAEAAGVPVRLFPVPGWALEAGSRLLGKADALHRLCESLQVDISKARDLLGWVPPVSVEQGLQRAFAAKLKL